MIECAIPKILSNHISRLRHKISKRELTVETSNRKRQKTRVAKSCLAQVLHLIGQLKKWRDTFGPIRERFKVKAMQTRILPTPLESFSV